MDGNGTPVPIRGSFSYAVTAGEIAETTGHLKVQGAARGSDTVPRMQCVADREESLEKALRIMKTAEMDACFFQRIKIAPRRLSPRNDIN